MSSIFKILLSIWVGSLWWMIVVAMVIFDKVPTVYLAGNLANILFDYIDIFTLVVLFFVNLFLFKKNRWKIFKIDIFWISLFIFLIVLAGMFGIQPIMENLKNQAMPSEVMESIFADRFAKWHGISSIAYLIKASLAVSLLFKWR